MSKPDDLLSRSATELRRLIGAKELSARELMAATIERLEKRNPELNAYVSVRADEALTEAAAADARLASGAAVGPLHGLPLALKGLSDYKAGLPINFGSRIFADHVAGTTINYVSRLEEAGAIVVGSTNVPEFGHKGVTDNLINGATSAPWRIGANSGGSSGGSAAATADGMCALSLGSDGGGSIRIPAAMCGVYGFKATYGRVPVVGAPDGFSTHTPFIHVGPITRTVADSELMLGVLTQAESRDPMSMPRETRPIVLGGQEHSLSGLRVAYTTDFGGFPIAPDVRSVVDAAVGQMEAAGAVVTPVSLTLPQPHFDLTQIWIRQISLQNAAAAHHMKRSGGLDMYALLDELTPEYAEMLQRGRVMTAVELRLDEIVRTQVFHALEDVVEQFDVLVGPTLSVASVDNETDGLTVGPRVVNGVSVDPSIGWCPTFLVNFTGHPAASIPAGTTPDGAPVGLQILASRFDDHVVLQVSRAFEALHER